jgi:hypothetical protein
MEVRQLFGDDGAEVQQFLEAEIGNVMASR